jgi:DNA-binding CsgD family transcriptional regulator
MVDSDPTHRRASAGDRPSAAGARSGARRVRARFGGHGRDLVCACERAPGGSLARPVRSTPAEARLAALVGSGLSPRESAEKLGITEETARTVLKRVFSKTGVSRQSELAALLTKPVLR